MPGWRVGRAHGPAARLAEDDRGIWCWICGRPLGQGEDIGPWRLRTARPSPRWLHELRPICPAHYEPPDQGQAPPEADLSQGVAQDSAAYKTAQLAGGAAIPETAGGPPGPQH